MNAPVGIAGCSGSGKTPLAEELARELEGTHFHLDHYYRDFAGFGYEERCRKTLTTPASSNPDCLLPSDQ
ncbi:MAG: hypothetical protein WBX22_15270 [Silvibacterium sp.]